MGRSTDTDVVPFVVHGVWYSDNASEELGTESSIFLPEMHFEYTEEIQNHINGWELISTDLNIDGYPNTNVEHYGKHKTLYVGTGWRKNDSIVWIINESEYESVGCADIALAADSRETLESFISEVVKIKCPDIVISDIEENDAVQQTL